MRTCFWRTDCVGTHGHRNEVLSVDCPEAQRDVSTGHRECCLRAQRESSHPLDSRRFHRRGNGPAGSSWMHQSLGGGLEAVEYRPDTVERASVWERRAARGG